MEIQGESEQQGRNTGGVKGLKGDSRGEAEELDGLGRGGRGKLGGTILNEEHLELGRANGNKGDLRLTAAMKELGSWMGPLGHTDSWKAPAEEEAQGQQQRWELAQCHPGQ